VSQVEAHAVAQEYSCRKLNLVSDFLQDNLLRAIPFRPETSANA
jgi:hypothetical protein